jgi:hypothetical protein
MGESVFSKREKEIELRKLDVELEQQKLDLAQKKALEHEAKEKYGSGWKKVLGIAKNFKPNSETLQDLYSLGISGEEMRSLTRPGGGKVARKK